MGGYNANQGRDIRLLSLWVVLDYRYINPLPVKGRIMEYIVIIEQNGRKVGECRLSEIGDPKSFDAIQKLTGREWFILPEGEEKWEI